MAIIPREVLKSYFDTGDVPNQQNYYDLIDTIYDIAGAGLTPHSSTHKHGGIDEIAVSVPAANAIVKAKSDGKIDSGWLDISLDHGDLSGLEDDDHSQYLNIARHDLLARHSLGTIVPHDSHDLLSGLLDDDHPQYLKTDGSRFVTGSLLPNLSDTIDLGSSTKLWRRAWISELQSLIFAKNTITLLGGWLMISKNEGSITNDVDSSQTQIDFEQLMTVGDFVIFRNSLSVEYMEIGTLVSGTTYNVTRNLDGSGANNWPAGSVYAVLGQVGDGRIEINAYDTPRISILEQGSLYNEISDVVRIGDMNGSYGISEERYGFAVGDYSGGNYLKYDLLDGLRMRSADGALEIDSLGLKISATNVFEDARSIRFIDEESETHSLIGTLEAITDEAFRLFNMRMSSPSNSYMGISASSPSSGFAQILLEASSGGSPPTSSSIVLAHGEGGATNTIDLLANKVTSSGDLILSSGKIELPKISSPDTPDSNKAILFLETSKEMLAFKDDQGFVIPACIGRYNLSFIDAYITGATRTTLASFIQAWGFRNSVNDLADWNFSLPAGWAGKPIVFDFWWTISDTGSGNIVISVEGRNIENNVVLPGSVRYATVTSSSPAVSGKVVKATTSQMTLWTNAVENQAIAVRLYRVGGHASDTYGGTAYFIAGQARLI